MTLQVDVLCSLGEFWSMPLCNLCIKSYRCPSVRCSRLPTARGHMILW